MRFDLLTEKSTNPVDGHIIVSAFSSIRQDELHLNQVTAQPHSKNPINATTDNDGINGNIFNPSIYVWHEEWIGAQATTKLDSGASVEPFPSPIGKRLLHAALINNAPTTPIQDQALPNHLCNHLPRISIIATNLQIPFPHNMEHRWKKMIVMLIFPLVFSNGNWIALQQPSNNFTWLKICMSGLGLH